METIEHDVEIKILKRKVEMLSQYSGGLALILVRTGIIKKSDIDKLNQFLNKTNDH